ncbi:hypothetical protein ACIQXQ_03660 [Peribacillus sp. NPDC097198]|uniref:hypothetical protein n=1 Tax=Peribacillus sp. NPDC097198 TaxID=3364397 RepID=UPI00380FD4C7
MFGFFRMYRFTLSILLLSIIVLSGCGTTNKMDFYENTDSTSLSEEVNTISLNSTEDKIKEILGEPDFVEEVEKSKSTYLIYGKDRDNSDIEFQIVNGQVASYFFSNNTYKTSKKITKGSSKEDVIQEYGENYYERDDSGAKIMGYFDKNQKVNMEFSFNETIEGIIISKIN